ncbi:MAG TPA: c-type cytochrome [Epsilonproteobacteria bacterium]|nr:c-type cytochrome [Campylobacterota bacterium]
MTQASDETFISHYEYGEMLYQYPRGVSCVSCHGASGEGKEIARYKEEGEERKISGPDIRSVSLPLMAKAVNSDHEIMPRYYLTKEEIKAIFDYLQQKNSTKALP